VCLRLRALLCLQLHARAFHLVGLGAELRLGICESLTLLMHLRLRLCRRQELNGRSRRVVTVSALGCSPGRRRG
jgi:hypothetical protein